MSFAADMSKFCKDVAPEYLERVTRKVLIECADRAIFRSPVGNPDRWQRPGNAPAGYAGGAFRRNWQYNFGSAPSGPLDGIDPSGGKTVAEIRGGISASGGKAGVHYIGNASPYAERIENGWSSIAPNGIVSRIELEFADIVRIAKG
jgi:hypothetical protein